jgi:hypothetical protein
VSWLSDLDRELAAVGIPARRRRRIAAELADHLRCDPKAPLGDPHELARRFADELGTAYARRAGFAVFLALVPVGLLFLALAALFGPAGFRSSDVTPIGPAVVIGVQLAFVGGVLAALRAWRIRRSASVGYVGAAIVLRRAAFGIAGGALTIGGLGAAAFRVPGDVAVWFTPLLAVTAAVGVVTLAAASVTLASAYRLRPVTAGVGSGDLESDLGALVPARLRGGDWRLAVAIAGLVALCIAAAGIVQGDPFDGLARAIVDGAACLAGYALLGRYLGLRRR